MKMSSTLQRFSFKVKTLQSQPISVIFREKSSKHSTGDDAYQFLQRSRTPTLHFQKSLPRLPVPDLEKTGQRYLAALNPLLAPDDFKKTEKIVSDFCKGEGQHLQNELIALDKKSKHTNYISGHWFDKYLSDRISLPINYNPAIILNNDPRPEYNSQLIRASNIIISSVRFLKSLRNNVLEPEVFHLNAKKSDTELFRAVTRNLPSAVAWYGAYLFNAYPLDMSQYSNLFNTCRIPEIGKDRIFKDETCKHILIMRNGNFYIFDVLDKDGNLVAPEEVFTCVDYILKDASPASGFPVGVLTTENRDVWAKQRVHLVETGNGEALKKIHGSILLLSLDDFAATEPVPLMRNFLHGFDGANRWFDKSLSIYVTKNGVAGINFEHAWGDGVAVLRYFQDIFKDTVDKPRVHPTTKTISCNAQQQVRKLEFNLDDEAKAGIETAKHKYKTICDSLQMDVHQDFEFTKGSCKRHRLSPDSVMQLGFQAAYHKMTGGKFSSTYESCSTAAFLHGRTETLRPFTNQVRAYCEALTKKEPRKQLYNRIQACSKQHLQLTREAATGQGFDRHLFALRKLARDCDPELFVDPAYAKLNTYTLSTSTLNSPVVLAGGFGPVLQNGYGIAYMINEDWSGILMTSYKGHSDGGALIDAMGEALHEISAALQENEPEQPKKAGQ